MMIFLYSLPQVQPSVWRPARSASVPVAKAKAKRLATVGNFIVIVEENMERELISRISALDLTIFCIFETLPDSLVLS